MRYTLSVQSLFYSSLLLLFGFGSCNKCSKQNRTAIFVLVDQTDEYNFKKFTENYSKDIDNILRQYTFDQCAGGYFKLSTINDLSDNENYEAKYPEDEEVIPAGKTIKYIQDNLGLPDKFTQQVSTAMANIANTNVQFKNVRASKIYNPICEALNDLNELESEKKALIIYSDMLENSTAFRFYEKMTDPNPEKTLQQMATSCDCELPAIGDIEIYIVAHHNQNNDRVIEIGKKFWKKVFNNIKKAKRFSFDENLNI